MRAALCLLLGLGFAGLCVAADPIEELVVSGEQPGPGLWQVRHGDHSLWILATLSPLPAKMRWRTREVEALVAHSQQVIAPMNLRAGIGLFTGLRLLPAVLRARALPKGATLATVLPPALYARWLPLKKQLLKSIPTLTTSTSCWKSRSLFPLKLSNHLHCLFI